jgi:deazaflavin-dependent oxidoreductase (nitroreductase family)
MLNDHAPTRSPGLKTASAALGALAVGALAIGAVAIGAVTIGRLVIGRSRIRRLEIDQLVVGSLQVRDSLVTPEMSSSENNAGTTPETHYFKSPTSLDRVINSGFGFLVRLGLGLPHTYLLEVRGRRSGRLYSMPVNVLTRRNKRYLVAPRGYTDWVRNAIVAGRVSLRQGRRSEEFGIRLVSDEEKPGILKSYLDRYHFTVQRYFPLAAGSPSAAFRGCSSRYPVFELLSAAN